MIWGLWFLFWRDSLPTGGIGKCFPCRRQMRKSGLLRLFWKLKLIKMFILAPVAKTRRGRKSNIHFDEGVIRPTNLCVPRSACAPELPHLLKHLPSVWVFGVTVLNAEAKAPGVPHSHPRTAEPRSLSVAYRLTSEGSAVGPPIGGCRMWNPGEWRAHCAVSFCVRDLSILDFDVWEGTRVVWNQSPADTEGQLYSLSFTLSEICKDMQKRKRKREREKEELKIK